MHSKIHKLYVKAKTYNQMDEYGRYVQEDGEQWDYLCECRCDDAGDAEIATPAGELVRPQFHIVCEGQVHVDFNAEVKCMNGDILRGTGRVKRRKTLNFLPYTELWVL